MLKQLLLFISLLCLVNGWTQTITIEGKTVDIEGDPAPGVTYFLKKNPDQTFKTDKQGFFTIKMNIAEYDTLVFKSVQFERTAVFIGKKSIKTAEKNNGILELEVVLPDRMFNIFTVRPNVPDTVCCGNEFSVEDFVRAVRHGIDKDGKPIFMPAVLSGANLSDEDLAAIIAYIQNCGTYPKS